MSTPRTSRVRINLTGGKEPADNADNGRTSRVRINLTGKEPAAMTPTTVTPDSGPISTPTRPLTGVSARTNRYTVGDLRKVLADLPDEIEVVINPMCGCDDAWDHEICEASYTRGLVTIVPA